MSALGSRNIPILQKEILTKCRTGGLVDLSIYSTKLKSRIQ